MPGIFQIGVRGVMCGCFEPEVLQSRFGMTFLFWPGEFWKIADDFPGEL